MIQLELMYKGDACDTCHAKVQIVDRIKVPKKGLTFTDNRANENLIIMFHNVIAYVCVCVCVCVRACVSA